MRTNRILTVLIVCLLLFFVVHTFFYFKTDVVTETVKAGQMEDAYTTSAFLLRDEVPIAADAGGSIDQVIPEGEKVSKGTKVAVVYKEQIDPEVQRKLNSVNERITAVSAQQTSLAGKEPFSEDASRIDDMIKGKISNIREEADSGSQMDYVSIKNDLNKLVDKKLFADGGNGTASQHLNSLKQEKANLESKFNAQKSDCYAPQAGIISYQVDGLEQLLNVQNKDKFTPSALTMLEETYQKEKKEKQTVIGKIVSAFDWAVCYMVEEAKGKELKVGQAVEVRLKIGSIPVINGQVSFISPAEQGKVAVVISLAQYIPQMLNARKVDIDVIRDSFQGFKIPVGAIHVKDGVTGVYVVSEQVARFRAVDVAYKNEQYAIARENNLLQNGLLLYDELIVRGNNVEDGKLLRQH